MQDMNLSAQRLCVSCGPFMIVLWAAPFAFLSRMIPPPDPRHTPAQVVHQFAQHTVDIRIGLVISLFACALLVPFGAVIAAQMRRIEGGRSVLAETQLVSCGLLCVEFLIPFAMFKRGPFAWNGFLAWWVPLTVYLIWFVLMTMYLLRAIKQDEREQDRARAAATVRAPGSLSGVP
jgi:hypothetical protein